MGLYTKPSDLAAGFGFTRQNAASYAKRKSVIATWEKVELSALTAIFLTVGTVTFFYGLGTC